jgi:hypothetical protein
MIAYGRGDVQLYTFLNRLLMEVMLSVKPWPLYSTGRNPGCPSYSRLNASEKRENVVNKETRM